ncbi:MAG TPA: SDR family oxidoreductase [Acidimicrobiales bacterium]|nr:SDR family oxidoreductase [Acidimicrobiales bacterium]
MRLLLLGGTGFVGRHITDAALDAGHDVTLFNRGRTNAGGFPDAARLVGDRESGDLTALAGGEWDAVVDVNAYTPRRVREAIAALDGRVGHYTFVSTVSVYVHGPSTGVPDDESAPLERLEDPTSEEVTNASYGALKVLCEEEVQAAFPDASTIVRPGMVAGPHDPTDRFTWWVRRAARGGEMLVPDRPDQPVQVVHARDQADFVVAATVSGRCGDFNSVGPSSPLTLRGLVEACAAAAQSNVEPVWVDEAFVAEHDIPFPLYLPSDAAIDNIFEAWSAAVAAGLLVNRSIVDTAADTLAWDRTRPDQSAMGPGTLSPERESELLEAWRSRAQAVGPT